MADQSKNAVEQHELRASFDKPKTTLAANQSHNIFFQEFAQKDEEWVDYKTKHLLRKVDGHLLPMLIIMYLLNFLDRSNLAQARTGGLEADLGMEGTQFNTAVSGSVPAVLNTMSADVLRIDEHLLRRLPPHATA